MYRHLVSHPKTVGKFNSYLVDVRNHGKSFWDDSMSLEEMAQDVKVWLDEHKFGGKEVTMVGHSMGGRVLVSLTEQFPELSDIIKKIVIVDAAPHSYEGSSFIPKSM